MRACAVGSTETSNGFGAPIMVSPNAMTCLEREIEPSTERSDSESASSRITASNCMPAGTVAGISSGEPTHTGHSEFSSPSPSMVRSETAGSPSLSMARSSREAARWSASAAFHRLARAQRRREAPEATCAESASRYSASSRRSFSPSFIARKSSPEIMASSADCHQARSSSDPTACAVTLRARKSSISAPRPCSASCSVISVRSGNWSSSLLCSSSLPMRPNSVLMGSSRSVAPESAGSSVASLSSRAPASW